MIEYLAKYTVYESVFKEGAWVSRAKSHIHECKFEAKNDEEAVKLAEEYMKQFKMEYVGLTPLLTSY